MNGHEYVDVFDAEVLALRVADARDEGRPFDVLAALDELPVTTVCRDVRPFPDCED